MRKVFVSFLVIVGLLTAMAAPAMAQTIYYRYSSRVVNPGTGYRIVRIYYPVTQPGTPTVPQPKPPTPTPPRPVRRRPTPAP